MWNGTSIALGALLWALVGAFAPDLPAQSQNRAESIPELNGQGVVTAWRFVNPHPILRVEVTRADGENALWNVNFGPPAVSALRRRGFSVETFQPGEIINVKGHPATAPGALSIKVQGPESAVSRGDSSPIP